MIQSELTKIKRGAVDSEYFSSKDEKEILIETIDIISRDIKRTFRSLEISKPDELGRVLEAISFIKSDVGYCQGMNFIAAGLITLTNSEEKALGFFLIFLNEYELNNMFIKVIKKPFYFK